MNSSDVSDPRVMAEFSDLLSFVNEMRAEFRNTSSLVDNINFWPPAPNTIRDTPDNSDDNGPT